MVACGVGFCAGVLLNMHQEGAPRDPKLSVRTAYWLIIIGVIAACVFVRQADPGFLARLRLLGFDLLQQTLPRKPDPAYPVRIIDIDEASIKSFGNWPWQRELLARLLDQLFAQGVRLAVFDIVFPEAGSSLADLLPPELRNAAEYKPLIDKLAATDSADTTFAKAIGAHPTVLGIIATSRPSEHVPAPKASFVTIGDNVLGLVPSFRGASGNLPALEKAAAGIGALNWLPDHDQILRRIPLIVGIGDKLYPSLTAEALRVFNGAKTIRVRSAGEGGFSGDRGISTIGIGDSVIPTDSDGQLWLSFSRHDPKRSISAGDVLRGGLPEDALKGRIAIIGTSAPGLLDLRATPLDPVISGVEINAQALEQLLSDRLLIRPDYAVGMEIALTVITAALLGAIVYWWGAGVSAAVGFGSVCAFALAGLWAFSHGILFDAVFPIITSTAAYIFGTGYLYYQAEGERNRGREALLRIAREMESAAQIQRTFLPKEEPSGIRAGNFEVSAIMKPAKAVGGDFYDYFQIGEEKLAFVIGDVSGKGVAAALFMSVSRTVLRTVAFELDDPGAVLSKVNTILSRDNSEGMFVTVFYAVLELQTGNLSYTSAGHDDGLLIRSSGDCEALGYMGPAIGLFEGIEYPTAARELRLGDTVVLLTDGITEAFNIDGRVFSIDRVVRSITRRKFGSAKELVHSLADEVAHFSEGTEQSDDITCIVTRFKGQSFA